MSSSRSLVLALGCHIGVTTAAQSLSRASEGVVLRVHISPHREGRVSVTEPRSDGGDGDALQMQEGAARMPGILQADVIALPVVAGNPAYVDWVLRETADAADTALKGTASA